MNVQKPKYIRKYDFIYYFTRPKDQWFIKNSELENYINEKIQSLPHSFNITDDPIDSNDENEYDPLEEIKIKKLSHDTWDETDSKIHEGNLLDKSSREFIKKKYHLDVIDFDEKYPKNFDFDFLFNETINILKQRDNVILFQPVFIYKNKAITRPDGLVKIKGKYHLIEVKGTSKSKLSHLIDVLFQAHVVNGVLEELNSHIDEYYLCLVKYELLTKNNVSFVLTDHVSLNKSGNGDSKDFIERYQGFLKYSYQAIEERAKNRIGINDVVTIKDLIDGNIINLKKRSVKDYEKNILPLIDRNTFNLVIEEIINSEPCDSPSLLPDLHYKSFFKDYSQWHTLRKYYFNNNKYPTMQWSGYILTAKKGIQAFLENNTNIENLINSENKWSEWFNDQLNPSLYKYFDGGCFLIKETNNKFGLLKKKKVYFDFETINPAIRVVDDTTPFTQIVTQVSIIKDTGLGIKDSKSTNVVYDPLTISEENFKEIIDALYMGNEYSYVVYNKGFECSRLKEMAALIGEQEYKEKVNIINNNIYDLADFFDPRKHLITIRMLKGYYSIKNVLPIIQQKDSEIFNETSCKDYIKDLEIHNGSEALNITARRFFKLIDNTTWENTVNNLKLYCENDVRAMIAVEYFIRKLLESN